MIVVDALIFMAQNIAGLFYAIGFVFWSLAKALLLILKPLWYIFFFVFAFVKTLFTTPIGPLTSMSLWTPDANIISLFRSFPFIPLLLTVTGLLVMITVTIKAFTHGHK